MEHAITIRRLNGIDVSFGKDNQLINIENCPERQGASGYNKNCSLAKMFELAYQTKANIIAKGGPNAKWYLKKIDLDTIEEKIRKQEWRNTSRVKLWIIHWEN